MVLKVIVESPRSGSLKLPDRSSVVGVALAATATPAIGLETNGGLLGREFTKLTPLPAAWDGKSAAVVEARNIRSVTDVALSPPKATSWVSAWPSARCGSAMV